MTRVVTPEPADAMETIRHLRAELQSVLEREAATHARHDARGEALEAQIADLEAAVQPAPVSILGEHDGVLPDDVYNILTKTEPAAPVTVEEAARVLLDNQDAVLELAVQIVRHNKSLNGKRPGIHPSLTDALRASAGEKPNE